ncbi:hypothetical protein [Bacillus cereus]|uniref:hypothetical protein n=1 Tax=Bacillus cereus TaxID=1396 RepID=UPI0034C6861C
MNGDIVGKEFNKYKEVMDKQLNDVGKSINLNLDKMQKLEVSEDLMIKQKIILSIHRKLIEQIDSNLIGLTKTI